MPYDCEIACPSASPTDRPPGWYACLTGRVLAGSGGLSRSQLGQAVSCVVHTMTNGSLREWDCFVALLLAMTNELIIKDKEGISAPSVPISLLYPYPPMTSSLRRRSRWLSGEEEAISLIMTVIYSDHEL